MRHGVLFYEATGLIPADLTFPHGILFYDSTRGDWLENCLLVILVRVGENVGKMMLAHLIIAKRGNAICDQGRQRGESVV